MSPGLRGLVVESRHFGPAWIELAAKAGLTALGIHPAPGVAPEDPRSLESLLAGSGGEAFSEGIRGAGERGIQLILEAHAMRWLLPRSHFGAHPEWFRLDEGGRRNPDSNFCPSSEPALRIVEDRTREAAERISWAFGSHRYHLWMDDNSRYCHCARCRDLSPSDQAMLAYNRMLGGLRKADPLGSLAYLAYQGTLRAPEKVSPLPGIFLEFAPVDRDSRFPLENPANADSRSPLPGLLARFGKQGSQVLEYWMDNSYFYRWTPPYGELPFYRGVIRRDAIYYRDLGFENIFSFACGLDQGYEGEYGPPPVEEFGRILEKEFA